MEIIDLGKGWKLDWGGFRSPCTLITPDGRRIHGHYGNSGIKVDRQSGMRGGNWPGANYDQPETFRPVVDAYEQEISRVDREKLLATEIAEKTGWKKLHGGRYDTPEFWHLYTDGRRSFEFSNGRISVTVSGDRADEYEEVDIPYRLYDDPESVWRAVEKAIETEPPKTRSITKKQTPPSDVKADRKAINADRDRRKGGPLRRAVDEHYPKSQMKDLSSEGVFTFHVVDGKQDMKVDIHVPRIEEAKKIIKARYPGAKISGMGEKKER